MRTDKAILPGAAGRLGAYAGILILALALRLWDLGGQALHHDESLHAVYSWYLFDGRGYLHNPLMHGPFQFFGTAGHFLAALGFRLHGAIAASDVRSDPGGHSASAPSVSGAQRRYDHVGSAHPLAVVPLLLPLCPQRHLHGGLGYAAHSLHMALPGQRQSQVPGWNSCSAGAGVLPQRRALS